MLEQETRYRQLSQEQLDNFTLDMNTAYARLKGMEEAIDSKIYVLTRRFGKGQEILCELCDQPRTVTAASPLYRTFCNVIYIKINVNTG